MSTKITVCQFPEGVDHLESAWADLRKHTEAMGSDLVLLPEMPFAPWLSAFEEPDAARWKAAAEEHRQWLPRFAELGAAVVAGSHPIEEDGDFYNEAFIWTAEAGYQAVHRKRYLPNEEGFREARWYKAAPKHFEVVDSPVGKIGFLICTEIWFTEWAREYARQGIHFLLCPRATASSVEKWLVGGRAAAIMSGAWCLSSNRGGLDERGWDWAGGAWIVEPEDGEVHGVTGSSAPFITLEVDATAADRAKATYPRYVVE